MGVKMTPARIAAWATCKNSSAVLHHERNVIAAVHMPEARQRMRDLI